MQGMFTLLLRSSNVFFYNQVFPSSSHLNQGECSWIRSRSGTMFSLLQWHGQMQESWESGFSPVLRAVERFRKGEGGTAFKKPTNQKNTYTPPNTTPYTTTESWHFILFSFTVLLLKEKFKICYTKWNSHEGGDQMAKKVTQIQAY